MIHCWSRSPLVALSKYTAATILVLGVIATTTPKTAAALTVNRNFTGGITPTTIAGGGNIIDIFNIAADWWEASILDSFTLNVDFGWANLPGSTLATASTFDPIPISNGIVQFDNTGTNWFLDATPADNSEYQTFTETSQNLGGGVVNTSREFSAFFGDAFGRFDLLTVVAHEIGHLLGILDFISNPLPSSLLITGPRPNPGTLIDTVAAGGGHLSNTAYPSTLMNPFVSQSVRRSLSGIDILAAAERSDFVELNLDPLAAPIAVAEPAPLTILILGLLATIGFRRRKTDEL